METLYSVLDVLRSASDEEIKTAFYRKASKHHPDRGGDEAVMADINRAYNVLINPTLRRKYDNELKMLAELCPNCRGAGVVYKQKGFANRIPGKCDTCNGNGVLRWKGTAPANPVIVTTTSKRRGK